MKQVQSKILLILFIGSLAFTTACEIPSFSLLIGSGENDKGRGIAVDPCGNVYVAGDTEGSIDGNPNSGLEDAFLVKINPLGEIQWARQIGTASSDQAFDVSIDSHKNVYVTGYTRGNLDGNINQGGPDIFLAKYDSNGVKQWTRQIGTAEYEHATGVSIDKKGNVYVSGHTYGNLDGNINQGDLDIFLIKYDSNGVKQWTRQTGSITCDTGFGISVDPKGNAYITGYTFGDLDGNINQGGSDIFLIKYDPNGVKQWSRQIGTSEYDHAFGVSVDSKGNAYIAGHTRGNLDGNINQGGSDIIVIKYDPNGVKQWVSQTGTIIYDLAYGVSVNSDGNIYIVGHTLGDLDGNGNQGGSDIFLIKYDSSGVRQWTGQTGTTVNDFGLSVSVDSHNNIYITGYTSGDIDGNKNQGGDDIFVIRYDSEGKRN